MSGGLALPELGLLAASWGVLVAGMTLRVVRAGNGWREAAGWGASGCLRRGRVLWAEILGFVAAVAAGGGSSTCGHGGVGLRVGRGGYCAFHSAYPGSSSSARLLIAQPRMA